MREKIIKIAFFIAIFSILGTKTSLTVNNTNEKEKIENEARFEQIEPCEKEVEEIGTIEIIEDDIQEEMYFDSLEVLAICIEAEAGNQDLMGKRLVANVILNRVDSDDFPDDIVSVISQPHQFSTYTDGGMEKVTEPSEETFEAVRLELEHRTDDKILYFTAGGYNKYCIPAYKYGDHYFGY